MAKCRLRFFFAASALCPIGSQDALIVLMYSAAVPFGSCPVWIDVMARLRSSMSSVDIFSASVVPQLCDFHLMIALLKLQSLPCIWFNINRKSTQKSCRQGCQAPRAARCYRVILST